MKTWKVVCGGKTISRHIDFYHAQGGVERHLRNRKIDNNYEIIPIEFKSQKEYVGSIVKANKENEDGIEEWLEANWNSTWCDPDIFSELLKWLKKFYNDIKSEKTR